MLFGTCFAFETVSSNFQLILLVIFAFAFFRPHAIMHLISDSVNMLFFFSFFMDWQMKTQAVIDFMAVLALQLYWLYGSIGFMVVLASQRYWFYGGAGFMVVLDVWRYGSSLEPDLPY